MFFAQIEFDVNELLDKNKANASSYPYEIYLNGIKANFLPPIQSNYNLTRLICFLNLEGPRKILKRENFGKASLLDSISIKGKKHQEKNGIFSH